VIGGGRSDPWTECQIDGSCILEYMEEPRSLFLFGVKDEVEIDV